MRKLYMTVLVSIYIFTVPAFSQHLSLAGLNNSKILLTDNLTQGPTLEHHNEAQQKTFHSQPPSIPKAQEELRAAAPSFRLGKSVSVLVFAEGLYAIESLSGGWSAKSTGVGILQGFGAGIQLNYYLADRVSVNLQGGSSKWQVQRKYVSIVPEKVLQFSSDETITRIPLQVGFKLYPIKNMYFNPYGGGQFTKRVRTTTELHPEGPGTAEATAFLPAVGGAIGFEKYLVGGLFLDVAAQYNYVINTDFAGISDALHFAGLRAGIGYKFKATK